MKKLTCQEQANELRKEQGLPVIKSVAHKESDEAEASLAENFPDESKTEEATSKGKGKHKGKVKHEEDS